MNYRPPPKLTENAPEARKVQRLHLRTLVVPPGYLKQGSGSGSGSGKNAIRTQGILLRHGRKAFLSSEYVGAPNARAFPLKKKDDGWVLEAGTAAETINVQNHQIQGVELVDEIWHLVQVFPPAHSLHHLTRWDPPVVRPATMSETERSVSRAVFSHVIHALAESGEGITRKPSPINLRSPEWIEADEAGLMKVLGGKDPIVLPHSAPRSSFDFACSLVMARTETIDSHGNVVKRKCRVAADGRNDPRDIERAVELPDICTQRAAFLYGLTQDSIRISDVVAAYPHATMDERFRVGVRMPGTLPPSVRALGFEPGRYYPVARNYYGLGDAGKRFDDYLRRVAANLGYERIGAGVYKKLEAVWCA